MHSEVVTALCECETLGLHTVAAESTTGGDIYSFVILVFFKRNMLVVSGLTDYKVVSQCSDIDTILVGVKNIYFEY